MIRTRAFDSLWTGFIIAAVVVAAPRIATAQQAPSWSAVTNMPLAVYQTPPNQHAVFVSGPGNEIATIPAQQRVQVLGEHEVRTLLQRSTWYRIRIETGPRAGLEGWVYGGSSDGSETLRRA